MVTPRCSSQCYGQHNITFYVLLLKLTLCCSRNIIHDLCLRAFFSMPLLIILLLFELVTKHAWLFITYYDEVGDSWIVLP